MTSKRTHVGRRIPSRADEVLAYSNPQTVLLVTDFQAGMSIATEFTLASQVNGGGCLPPPTPPAPSKALLKVVADCLSESYEKANKQRPPAKGWVSTSQRALRAGVGLSADGTGASNVLEISPDGPTSISEVRCPPNRADLRHTSFGQVIAAVPQMGMRVVEGKATLQMNPRRTGELLHWETSTMAQNAQVFGSKAFA